MTREELTLYYVRWHFGDIYICVCVYYDDGEIRCQQNLPPCQLGAGNSSLEYVPRKHQRRKFAPKLFCFDRSSRSYDPQFQSLIPFYSIPVKVHTFSCTDQHHRLITREQINMCLFMSMKFILTQIQLLKLEIS